MKLIKTIKTDKGGGFYINQRLRDKKGKVKIIKKKISQKVITKLKNEMKTKISNSKLRDIYNINITNPDIKTKRRTKRKPIDKEDIKKIDVKPSGISSRPTGSFVIQGKGNLINQSTNENKIKDLESKIKTIENKPTTTQLNAPQQGQFLTQDQIKLLGTQYMGMVQTGKKLEDEIQKKDNRIIELVKQEEQGKKLTKDERKEIEKLKKDLDEYKKKVDEFKKNDKIKRLKNIFKDKVSCVVETAKGKSCKKLSKKYILDDDNLIIPFGGCFKHAQEVYVYHTAIGETITDKTQHLFSHIYNNLDIENILLKNNLDNLPETDKNYRDDVNNYIQSLSQIQPPKKTITINPLVKQDKVPDEILKDINEYSNKSRDEYIEFLKNIYSNYTDEEKEIFKNILNTNRRVVKNLQRNVGSIDNIKLELGI